jgi:hypothetical protein
MNPFIERRQEMIAGAVSCFDRVISTGTFPEIGYAEALAGSLSYRDIRLLDYPSGAEPLRDELCHNAKRLAAEAGLKIEHIRSYKGLRREARIKAILAERGAIRAWCISSRPRNRAPPMGSAMTGALSEAMCARHPGDACSTTSISSMKYSACAMSVCPRGHSFVGRSISMLTNGSPGG